MSERGFGLPLMQSVGICTLLVTVGPYLSKYYLLYLIIIFGLIIFFFEKLMPLRRVRRNFTNHQKSSITTNQFKGKRRALSDIQYNDKTISHKTSLNKIMPRKLCTNDMISSKKMRQKTHRSARCTPNCVEKISRKMNCIASSRVFRAIIDQARTPKMKKYSLDFSRASKSSICSVNNLKRKSFHFSLQGLQ